MRMTIKNPNGKTYRLPASRAGENRMEQQQEMIVFYGDLVNLLGRYEDLGPIEELERKIPRR